MSRSTRSKNLPLVIQTISYKKLEGVLVCSPDNKKAIQLFFRQGELIHSCADVPDQAADEVLHQLLGWDNFQMNWQRLQVHIPRPNIAEDIRLAFLDVVAILTNNGTFEHPRDTRLEQDFFGSEQTYSKPLAAAAPIAIATSEATVQSVLVETNLLLPPGIQQSQLEELLSRVNLKEQIETLTRAHFTGYMYYRINNSQGDYGLVLLHDGTVTDMVYASGTTGAKQTGSQAYQTLATQSFTPEIFKVEAKILKAYRALVACEKAQRNLKPTRENCTSILTAFQQSRRDGIVLFYVDKLKLHYFFLFEAGVQVGVFGPDAKSGRLQPLATPLAMPTADASATITVLLASRQAELTTKTGSTQPTPPPLAALQAGQAFSTSPNANIFETLGVAAPSAVAWNGSLNEFATMSGSVQPQKKAPGRAEMDQANPFDF